jgi:hypothetical protein
VDGFLRGFAPCLSKPNYRRDGFDPLFSIRSMALYQHELFTLNLNKVISVFRQDPDEAAITIQTDDQRKIEVATDSPEAAAELLSEFAAKWESAVGPLLRHGQHVFLTSAIYSIQAQGNEVFIYFRDHSVSFALADDFQAAELLGKLTAHWQMALGQDVPEAEKP